jgi:UDP-glucose 4-epimerase
LAKAHVAAIQRMQRNQMLDVYETFNIGTGTGNSVLEVINAFERITNARLNYRVGPRREGDIIKIWADVSKATQELKWTAQLNLNDMLSSAWAWENYINNNPF